MNKYLAFRMCNVQKLPWSMAVLFISHINHHAKFKKNEQIVLFRRQNFWMTLAGSISWILNFIKEWYIDPNSTIVYQRSWVAEGFLLCWRSWVQTPFRKQYISVSLWASPQLDVVQMKHYIGGSLYQCKRSHLF